MDKTEMKPSAIIGELEEQYRSELGNNWAMVQAILDYLDEQHESRSK